MYFPKEQTSKFGTKEPSSTRPELVTTRARWPFFFSSRRRHTRYIGDWSSDVCSSDLARQRAVEARLSSMLIDAEAKKRGKTSSELVEAEVNSKIAPPTDQEIKAAYDANRDQIGRASCRERG